ncbi:MAG: hypothetical protein Q9222_001849 [Ikaeria aurantiellina]
MSAASSGEPAAHLATIQHETDTATPQILQTQLGCAHSLLRQDTAKAKLAYTAPVIYELKRTNDVEFYFLSGTVLCPPVGGVEEQYDGPYYRYFPDDGLHTMAAQAARYLSDQSASPEELAREVRRQGMAAVQSAEACDIIQRGIQEHPQGPFDGILGFSEGASLAASLILRKAAQGSAQLFKFAIFMCAVLVCHFEEKDVILADETSMRITIPTVHITGARDPGRQASMTLYNLCEPSCASLYQHNKGHTVPWGPPVKDMAHEIATVLKQWNCKSES